MKNAGDYIGNYRVLSLAKAAPFFELYVVEHTFAPTGPQALQLWPGVNLRAGSAFNAFFARSRALAHLHDSTLLSIKAGDGGLPTTFQFTAHGEWSLQLDAAGKQAVARGISGMEQVQAKNVLLRTFRSKTQSMTLSTFWGKQLPTDISAITIVGLDSLPPGS